MLEERKFCTNPFRKYLLMRSWGKHPFLTMVATIIAIQLIFNYMQSYYMLDLEWYNLIEWYEKSNNIPPYNNTFGFEDVILIFFDSIYNFFSFESIAFIILAYKLNKIFASEDYNLNIKIIPNHQQKYFIEKIKIAIELFLVCAFLVFVEVSITYPYVFPKTNPERTPYIIVLLSEYYFYFYHFPIYLFLTLVGSRLMNFGFIFLIQWILCIFNQALYTLMSHTESLGLNIGNDWEYMQRLQCFILGIFYCFFVLLYILFYYRKYVKNKIGAS